MDKEDIKLKTIPFGKGSGFLGKGRDLAHC